MYSSTSTDYQKYPEPTAPPPATGIPVSTAGQNYSDMPESRPPPVSSASREVPWSSGLFDCFSDMGNCCLTCWCPCITFGRISEIVDRGSSSPAVSGGLYTLLACVICCPCCYGCYYRKKMREQYSLQEAPCGDCVVHCFCDTCALCQEYRELEHLGFDMSLGWQENVEKQNKGVAMAPLVQGRMTR